MSIERVEEIDLPIETLLDHLQAWLVVQPEWVYLVALEDRKVRRDVARTIAHALTTIPTRDGQLFNRSVRRRIIATMRGGEA